ncbi:DegT/DnrJ/EryC1/StrS family aminotransferase [Bacillus sp. UMB0728]|uniref:DegT/DnrJ/EryC1/StrS family aminotransferase n=1 Tax=Bacillus sp. UMB0728 TaxID=2066052 RepID=UPI000C77BA47|nr:pyridoxal phosphate-dependent aminotransferase [Bacillus sp. UMB0728]
MINTSVNKKIFLSSPHLSGNEMEYIQEAFETNWIAPLGPNVDAFEKEVASYVGAKGAVALSSGTAAIHLALSVLGVNKSDFVFCSSLTFIATANPILYLGAEPVFIDSEPDTWNMSPTALKEAFIIAAEKNKLPKAVIVVNIYGQSAKMDELKYICCQYDVPIIEDAAESLGSIYKGKASGTNGEIGVYSFNGNKIITTSGGGMLVSDDTGTLDKVRFLATQAKDPAPYYQHSQIGYNYRLSNILAGVGRSQLRMLDIRVKQRRRIYTTYYKELSHLPGITFMPELEQSTSNRWLTVLTIDKNKAGVSNYDILHYLERENIEARLVWKPLHLQPLFTENSFFSHDGGEGISDKLFDTGICLPSGSNMSLEDQYKVIQCIGTIIS